MPLSTNLLVLARFSASSLVLHYFWMILLYLVPKKNWCNINQDPYNALMLMKIYLILKFYIALMFVLPEVNTFCFLLLSSFQKELPSKIKTSITANNMTIYDFTKWKRYFINKLFFLCHHHIILYHVYITSWSPTLCFK